MNIQDKMSLAKNQLTAFRTISKTIIDDGATLDGHNKIMALIQSYPIFEPGGWDSFPRLVHTLRKIYEAYDPNFVLPKLRAYTYALDSVYTVEHGYLLLKVDTFENENMLKIMGLSSLLESYQANTKEHTHESTYRFVMGCIGYFSNVARKMLSLAIFNPSDVVFLSLLCHYYLDYPVDARFYLNYITDVNRAYIHNDFKRMVFETNGAHPLSIRGNLPILARYAQKRARGHYRWGRSSELVDFIKNMKSNKALNLKKVFSKMENLLSSGYPIDDEDAKSIFFGCTVGVRTQEPHYDRYKKIHCVSDRPTTTDNNSIQLGILGTCGSPRETTFGEDYIGWVDFEGTSTVYNTYETVFNSFEDDIITTLEDNYNFLLEKMPELIKDRTRNDMLECIVGGL